MILLASAALAGPIRATTDDGRTVLLHDDGTWSHAIVEPEETSSERFGDWVVDLGISEITGAVRGGATTPNLDGPGLFALICRDVDVLPVFLFSGHALDAIDPWEKPRPFGYVGLFLFDHGGRTKIEGPAFDGVEGFRVPGDRIHDLIQDHPKEELFGVNRRPGRPGWPERVRFSLDGFEDAWAQMRSACREHPTLR